MGESSLGISTANSFYTGVQAFKSASDGIHTSVQELSKLSSSESVSASESLTNMLSYELQAKAAADVIKTADELVGSLVDVLA